MMLFRLIPNRACSADGPVLRREINRRHSRLVAQQRKHNGKGENKRPEAPPFA